MRRPESGGPEGDVRAAPSPKVSRPVTQRRTSGGKGRRRVKQDPKMVQGLQCIDSLGSKVQSRPLAADYAEASLPQRICGCQRRRCWPTP
jgi:hypothetical protein